MLTRAGDWFLKSGIQDEAGGVARFYKSDSSSNARVSAEITGYAVSTLVYLAKVCGRAQYLQAAERSAQYLVHQAWSEHTATFPFEPVSNGDSAYSYFFDCGIVARALLAIWRATGNDEYFERAKECGLSMAFDFMAEEAMHPIVRLPDKHPVPYERRWSRQPGCYQLKAAMAWYELAESTGHRELASAFERMLSYSLATHLSFLPGTPHDTEVMDRLHAYAYFLEGLLPAATLPEHAAALREGIGRVAYHLRRLEGQFARCDVYAQLLRLRLFADAEGVIALDEAAADYEAGVIRDFQANGNDRPTTGGFWFGRKYGDLLPFSNPVTTAFSLQALALWQEYQDGGIQTPVLALI